MQNLVLEVAKVKDASRLLEIYTPYVLGTIITFEYDVPSVKEFESRISTILKKYPYLVAKINDEIVGYAYTSAFKNRAAYQWAVETSIYVDLKYRGNGIGTALYKKLEALSKQQNILNMNACIAIPDEGSVSFHQQMGYYQVAHFHQCGYKFGKWCDMLWMEKILSEHKDIPKPFIPFAKLDYCIY